MIVMIIITTHRIFCCAWDKVHASALEYVTIIVAITIIIIINLLFDLFYFFIIYIIYIYFIYYIIIQ